MDGQTLPCENSLVRRQTPTLDHHHGLISGNGQTIPSIGSPTSTSGRHSLPDPVGDQTVSDDGWTITSVPHYVPNLVMGQTISSVRGQTLALDCHFRLDPEKCQTILSGRG